MLTIVRMKRKLKPSELVLDENGAVYHLGLAPHQLASTILLVGDQDRVGMISAHFDVIEHRTQHREFVAHTGIYQKKSITAFSSGIGTDNIDIVLNELYALNSFDATVPKRLKETRPLRIIRLGTCGALQSEIKLGEIIASQYGLGLDGLMHYYPYKFTSDECALETTLAKQTTWPHKMAQPYFTTANAGLLTKFGQFFRKGITATATGFYGPQGRDLMGKILIFNPLTTLQPFMHNGLQVTNFDMETAALYGLGAYFGFSCLTLNVVIANRANGTFVKDPNKAVGDLINQVLPML